MNTTKPKRIANRDRRSLSEAGEAARSHFRDEAERKQAAAELDWKRIASHEGRSLSEAGEAAMKHFREEAGRKAARPH